MWIRCFAKCCQFIAAESNRWFVNKGHILLCSICAKEMRFTRTHSKLNFVFLFFIFILIPSSAPTSGSAVAVLMQTKNKVAEGLYYIRYCQQEYTVSSIEFSEYVHHPSFIYILYRFVKKTWFSVSGNSSFTCLIMQTW